MKKALEEGGAGIIFKLKSDFMGFKVSL